MVRIDPDGSLHWERGCMQGVTRYPYRLPELIEARDRGEEIWVTEGEADVDALVGEGLVATTNPGGAGKWSDAYSRLLVGARRIVLWPDWDEAGREHMAKVYRSIRRASPRTEVRVVRSADGLKDAREHLDAGHALEATVAVEPSELALEDAYVDELNAEYAVVGAGTRTAILHEYEDPEEGRPAFELLDKQSFELRLANRRIGKSSIADLWLKHPDRRSYDRIVFIPGPGDPRYYNLWRGFAVEPRRGDCSRFLAHVRENICCGDRERYRWLMGWMAQAVRNPAQRPGTAIVLRGGQGVGRGIFCRGFGSLFGRHFLQVMHARHLVGNFNAHLMGILVLWGDEAFWAGDKQHEGVLRGLVTEPELVFEMKGRDAIRLPNRIRLLLSSNSDWVVPAGQDERRFAVLDVGEGRKQDRDYFGAIQRELDSGGREAHLYRLLHRDYSGVDVARIPDTAALRDQKLLSMGPVDKWWQGRLEAGSLHPIDRSWERWAPAKALHDDYIDFAKQAGQPRRAVLTEFGARLKRLAPGLRKVRRSVSASGERGYRYEFPRLSKCRADFDRLFGTRFEWPEEDDEEEEEKRTSRRQELARRKRRMDKLLKRLPTPEQPRIRPPAVATASYLSDPGQGSRRR